MIRHTIALYNERFIYAMGRGNNPLAAIDFTWATAPQPGVTQETWALNPKDNQHLTPRKTYRHPNDRPASDARATLSLSLPVTLAQQLLFTRKAHVIIVGLRHMTSSPPAQSACVTTRRSQVRSSETPWDLTMATGGTRVGATRPFVFAHRHLFGCPLTQARAKWRVTLAMKTAQQTLLHTICGTNWWMPPQH